MKRFIIASDVINGVQGFSTLGDKLKLLWESISDFIRIDGSNLDWIWIPGDSIWIAAPPEAWVPDHLEDNSDAAVEVACKILRSVLDRSKYFKKDKIDIRLAFAYGEAKTTSLSSHKNGFPYVWLGQGLNLAGRLLKLHSKKGFFHFKVAGFGVQGKKPNRIPDNEICPVTTTQINLKKRSIEEVIPFIYPEKNSPLNELLRGLPDGKQFGATIIGTLKKYNQKKRHQISITLKLQDGEKVNILEKLACDISEQNRPEFLLALEPKKKRGGKRREITFSKDKGKIYIKSFPTLIGGNPNMELVEGQYDYFPRSKQNINFTVNVDNHKIEIRPRYTIMPDILRDFAGGYERWPGDDYIMCNIT